MSQTRGVDFEPLEGAAESLADSGTHVDETSGGTTIVGPKTKWVMFAILVVGVIASFANDALPLFSAGGSNVAFALLDTVFLAAIPVVFLVRLNKMAGIKLWLLILILGNIAMASAIIAPANDKPLYYIALNAIGVVITAAVAYWDVMFADQSSKTPGK